MKSVAIVLLIALVCVVRAFDPDHCAPFMDCESCVAHHLCGWCSLPVVYEGNITGPQCAGFSPNGSTPFACNGIYSTEKCIQGYVCDQATFQCKMGPPGQGLPKDQCEKNCTNDGKVFLCNVTTKKCYNVPPGTPGSSALVVCEQACEHPTSSAGPTGAPAQTYECNHTTGNCIPTTPGKGTSKEVCEQTCTPAPMGGYLCNKFLQKCIKLPPNVPGGKTKEQCEEECNPSPNPGPPNHFLGVWRGFEIHNGYREGEWDMNFTQTSATIINLRDAVTIKGIPYQQRVADITILAIKVTSGPGAGQWWKAIYKQENRGPQTMYLTAAFGKPGESAPSDMATAMKDGSQVFFLAQCVGTPECVFTMPATIQARRKRVAEIHGFINDPCTSYGASCQECLSHQFCGWCSTKVQYADGVQGTQCAGFSSNPNTSNPFVCLGRYSTFKCTTGYDCDMMTYQCVPDNSPATVRRRKCARSSASPPPAPAQSLTSTYATSRPSTATSAMKPTAPVPHPRTPAKQDASSPSPARRVLLSVCGAASTSKTTTPLENGNGSSTRAV